MKLKIPSLVLVLNFLTLPALAKNQCSCEPLPMTKTYQGEARKRHFIGYSIDWSCTYQCKPESASGGSLDLVTGSYHEYYIGSENGTEGICEGMVYKPQYNPQVNQEIYVYLGENFSLNPSKSNSVELKKWAEANTCD